MTAPETTAPGLARTVHVEHVMGTVFSLDVRDGVAPGTLERVAADLHAVDDVFSTWRDGTPVRRLAAGEIGLGDCPPEVAEVLALCEQARELTGGLFDARASGALDPSGVVKGWAVERASALLAAGGSRCHSVNGGGDVALSGQPAPGRPWRVGVADPHRPGRVLAALAVTDGGVATSGTAERGGHVLDPRTGHPATALASATVVGPSLLRADVLATAALVAGAGAPDLLAVDPAYDWLLVDGEGRQTASRGWAARTA